MADHADLLTAAEFLQGAAQDFPTLQVMGDCAVAQINPVVQKQTVLTRNPQMVGGGHGREQGLA
jgi:hypothetical protein